MAEIKLFNRDCIAAMKDIEDGILFPMPEMNRSSEKRNVNLDKIVSTKNILLLILHFGHQSSAAVHGVLRVFIPGVGFLEEMQEENG